MQKTYLGEISALQSCYVSNFLFTVLEYSLVMATLR